jgi:hypothetical protein
VLRELLTDHPESVRWPESLRRARSAPAASRARCTPCWPGPARRAWTRELSALGRGRRDLPSSSRPGCSSSSTSPTSTPGRHRLRRPDPPRHDRGRGAPRRAARAVPHVFVDEYQDTDPGQVALLRALAGDGRNLTVVGDPHQSIYGFRGAEVRGILEFPTEFPRADGSPADGRRAAHHPPLRPAAAASPPSGWPAGSAARHHPGGGARGVPRTGGRPETTGDGRSRSSPSTPSAPRPSTSPTCSAGPTSRTASAGTRWRCWCAPAARASRRCAARSGPPACRSRSPATRHRWSGARGAAAARRAPRVVNLDNDDPDHVDYVDAGPRRGAAARAARRPGRRRRTPSGAAAARPREGPAHGDGRTPHLARAGPAAVVEPASSTGSTGPEASARALAWPACSAGPASRCSRGAPPRRCSGRSGPAPAGRRGCAARRRGRRPGQARRAHRDLDSVCALFEAAARAEEQRDHRRRRDFLATLVAQQIPADTLAERGVRGSAVRLLTAHRSKGLEWRLVVVAHVQQDGWPDLRRRSSLLQADRIGPTAAAAADHARAADGGAPALLRRVHPRPRAARRHRGEVARRRRRAAVPLPRRARPRPEPSTCRGRPRGRCRWPAWSPSCAVPSPTPTSPAAARGAAAPAGPARRPRPWVTAAGARRPTRRPGGARARRPRSVQPVRDPDEPVPVSASALEAC